MSYLILTQDEKDDTIVAFMLSQERDKHCHEINLERYTSMIKTLKVGGLKTKYTKPQSETASRLEEVNIIISATLSQMPKQARIDAAVARLTALNRI